MKSFASKLLLLSGSDPITILMVRSRRWSLPGGKIEHGESDEQALHRELKEEIPVLLQRITRPFFHSIYYNGIWSSSLFVAATYGDWYQVKPDAEIVRMKWVRPQKVSNYFWSPYFKKLTDEWMQQMRKICYLVSEHTNEKRF